ncbi:hypothetical protein [Flavobacterium sp. RS13.1]|uniref:hypothetical protein n=1 Tax=Flavobacterium sp. RS13.1 TaxID=3400345 RepID=UPI003AAAF5EC
MKENKFITLIIITLFGITVFTLFRFNKLKQQISINSRSNSNVESVKDDELNAYKVNFKTNLLNSNLSLNNVLMKDSINNIIPLINIFKNSQKTILVYRFSQMHCESCVIASIKIFVNWANLHKVKNICFLGNFSNNRIFYRTIPEYSIENMNVYNASDFDIPADGIGYPYCFILNNNMQISNVFVPDKGMPKLTTEYLKMIQNKLK